jgi:hypothetical protein
MADFRKLGLAACITALAAGCTAAPPRIEDVQDVGGGSYTIGYSIVPGLRDGRRREEAAAAAVSKAGDFCHAKDLKILVTGTGQSSLTFRCI